MQNFCFAECGVQNMPCAVRAFINTCRKIHRMRMQIMQNKEMETRTHTSPDSASFNCADGRHKHHRGWGHHGVMSLSCPCVFLDQLLRNLYGSINHKEVSIVICLLVCVCVCERQLETVCLHASEGIASSAKRHLGFYVRVQTFVRPRLLQTCWQSCRDRRTSNIEDNDL